MSTSSFAHALHPQAEVRVEMQAVPSVSAANAASSSVAVFEAERKSDGGYSTEDLKTMELHSREVPQGRGKGIALW